MDIGNVKLTFQERSVQAKHTVLRQRKVRFSWHYSWRKILGAHV